MSSSQFTHSVKTVVGSVTQPLWTWSGIYFGYRRDDSLFTFDGTEVGRFIGTEIFGADGSYLGDVKNAEGNEGQRLITSSYKKTRTVAAFAPTRGRSQPKAANRSAEALYCGYEEFPPPEIMRAMVVELTKGLTSFAGANRVS